MKKPLNKKKTLEFLTIMTSVVGTMVGAGIYVKNDNHSGHVLGEIGNPYMALILWAVTGIIVMAAIMIFIEIASSTAKHGNGTISNWLRLFMNKKIASAAGIYYVFIYLPVNYGFFAALIIQYVLAAAGDPITNKASLIALYVLVGMAFISAFALMNSFARKQGKYFQIIGTAIKFIPLILVLLALFIPDTTWGVIFNNSGKVENSAGDQLGNVWSTSFEDIDGVKVMSGFAPILFAFNGFIYAANMQAETENKEVVSKGILIGVLFTAIFYILISLSLFMGSKDGSVVSFFDYMFNGFKKDPVHDGAAILEHKGISTLLSNLILALVCLMGLNSYTLTGANFFNTDANNGIIFANNKKISQGTSGMVQMTIGFIAFIPLIILGIVRNPHEATYYMDQAGNAGAIIGFTLYALLILLAMVNRFTKKVEVEPINKIIFWICGPFSFLCLAAICIYSYVDFFSSDDLAKPLSMGISLAFILVLWLINEICLFMVPFVRNKYESEDLTIEEKNKRIKIDLLEEVNQKFDKSKLPLYLKNKIRDNKVKIINRRYDK